MLDGPLDMRMDTSAPLSAADIVNGWSEQALGKIIKEYGEDKKWRTIARRIVDARSERPSCPLEAPASPVLKHSYASLPDSHSFLTRQASCFVAE